MHFNTRTKGLKKDYKTFYSRLGCPTYILPCEKNSFNIQNLNFNKNKKEMVVSI